MRLIRNLLRKRKLNKKGFSLVELILAMAILAVVGVSIGSFISISSSSYVDATKEVDVQYEAQQTINQIKNIILDANSGVGTITPAVGESDATPFFVIYNSVSRIGESGTEDGFEVIKIKQIDDELYYGMQEYFITGEATKDEVLATINESGIATTNILAKGISSFGVDTTNLLKNNSVVLNIGFINGDSTYNTSNNITLRNKLVESDSARVAFSKKEVERNKYVTGIVIEGIIGASSQSVSNMTFSGVTSRAVKVNRPAANADGTTNHVLYNFKAVVDAYGVSGDKKWTLTGSSDSTSNGTYIDEGTGVLHLSSAEESRVLELTAISLADETKTDVIKVFVTWNGVTGFNWKTPVISNSLKNGSTESKYVFPFTASDIIFSEDTSSLTDTEKGFTWKICKLNEDGVTFTEYTVADGFTFNSSIGELVCSDAATSKQFYVVVTANYPATDGTVFSKAYPYTVSNLNSGGEGTPGVTWDSSATEVLRKTTFEKSASISGFTATKYEWKIEYIGTNWDDDAKSKVTISSSTDKKDVTVKVDENLKLDSQFDFKLKLVVEGTTSDGGSVSYEAASGLYTVPQGGLTWVTLPTSLVRNDSFSGLEAKITGIDGASSSVAYTVISSDKHVTDNVKISGNTVSVSYNLNWNATYTFKLRATSGSYTVDSEEYTIGPVGVVYNNLPTSGIMRNKTYSDIEVTCVNIKGVKLSYDLDKYSGFYTWVQPDRGRGYYDYSDMDRISFDGKNLVVDHNLRWNNEFKFKFETKVAVWDTVRRGNRDLYEEVKSDTFASDSYTISPVTYQIIGVPDSVSRNKTYTGISASFTNIDNPSYSFEYVPGMNFTGRDNSDWNKLKFDLINGTISIPKDLDWKKEYKFTLKVKTGSQELLVKEYIIGKVGLSTSLGSTELVRNETYPLSDFVLTNIEDYNSYTIELKEGSNTNIILSNADKTLTIGHDLAWNKDYTIKLLAKSTAGETDSISFTIKKVDLSLDALGTLVRNKDYDLTGVSLTNIKNPSYSIGISVDKDSDRDKIVFADNKLSIKSSLDWGRDCKFNFKITSAKDAKNSVNSSEYTIGRVQATFIDWPDKMVRNHTYTSDEIEVSLSNIENPEYKFTINHGEGFKKTNGKNRYDYSGYVSVKDNTKIFVDADLPWKSPVNSNFKFTISVSGDGGTAANTKEVSIDNVSASIANLSIEERERGKGTMSWTVSVSGIDLNGDTTISPTWRYVRSSWTQPYDGYYTDITEDVTCTDGTYIYDKAVIDSGYYYYFHIKGKLTYGTKEVDLSDKYVEK